MTVATANPGASAGSDSAPPSITLDDAANLDFYEPDDEKVEANVGSEEAQSESDEEEAGPEPQEPETEDDEQDSGDEPDTDDGEANDADENAIVMVKGEKLTVKELTQGYLRERDYRYKTNALGEQSRALKSTAARVSQTAEAIAEFLASQLPEEPTRTLAMQDPAEYTRRKAMFDAGLEQVQAILNLGKDPKQVGEQLSAEELEQKSAAEFTALANAFPELHKQENREKFFADAFSAGAELGFTPEEMREFNDHRYFKVMHWALKGLEADKAKKKALAKVETAPVMPPKGKSNGKAAQNARKNDDAMKRLSRTGSIKDAMLIDFD